MEKEEKNNFKDETKSSFVNFLSEVSNYVFVITTAIATLSLSIFMDLINSTCNLLRTGFTTFLAKRLQKNLKYKYNYGTEKLETLSMIFCDCLLVVGTLAILVFAVYQLFFPREVSDNMIFAVIFKSVNVFFGFILVIMNWRVYKKNRTKVAKTSFEATLGSFGFDFAIFLSVLTSFIFSSWSGVVYIEPIASILIAIFIIFKAIKRLRKYIKELVDVTLGEEDQLKIDTVLHKHFDKYEKFYSANSHVVGKNIHIDFRFSFTDDTTFKDIKDTLELFREELNQSFENIKVSFIVD